MKLPLWDPIRYVKSSKLRLDHGWARYFFLVTTISNKWKKSGKVVNNKQNELLFSGY